MMNNNLTVSDRWTQTYTLQLQMKHLSLIQKEAFQNSDQDTGNGSGRYPH